MNTNHTSNLILFAPKAYNQEGSDVCVIGDSILETFERLFAKYFAPDRKTKEKTKKQKR